MMQRRLPTQMFESGFIGQRLGARVDHPVANGRVCGPMRNQPQCMRLEPELRAQIHCRGLLSSSKGRETLRRYAGHLERATKGHQ